MNNFLTGADVLIRDNLELLKGKKIGIVTNHTALLKKGTHLVDTLLSLNINITALFAPEHGIRGISSAGEEIKNGLDIKTGIPVYSLYGKINKPTKEMLKDVDLIIYDIQDIGVRFYTYISTLFYNLQSAAENNLPVIILDRPDPINGITIEGPVIEEELKSFVGIAPVALRYGMTSGELAKLFSGEKWLGINLKPDLTVIKIQGWDRENYYDDYFDNWTHPSPNIPTIESALAYPGTCLLEGTNVSEGRGTNNPFITIGAPFINSNELVNELNKFSIEGAKIIPSSFIPIKIQGVAEKPKYENQKCNGISIVITDKRKFMGFEFGIKLISALIRLYPGSFEFNSYFDKLSGKKKIREDLQNGKSPDDIISDLQKEIDNFNSMRKKYLLY